MSRETPDIHEVAELPEPPKAKYEFAGPRLFALALLAALLVASMLRFQAMERARGPFIADSIEYLTKARHVTEGVSLAVKPVRPGVFPMLLAVPLWLERQLTLDEDLAPAGGAEDPAIGLWILLFFNVLAILGTYRLGVILRGPWTGLLGAWFLAVLPEFTRWSLDYLTDIPAAALGLWAIVFWIERKPFRAGLMIGLAVTMRYQFLIPLGAMFLVPLVFRRWRDLGRMSLGLVPPAILLGLTDLYYWGAPFHTLLIFVPRQLTTFLPVEVMAKLIEFLPEEVASELLAVPPGRDAQLVQNQALENYAAKGRWWYFEQSKWVLTIPLTWAIAVFPLAIRSLKSRRGGGFALWVTLVTLLVLSAQRYKEWRYLTAVMPMVCVFGAASATWAIGGVVRLLGGKGVLATGVGLVLLGALGLQYARGANTIQRRIWLSPFGAFLEAVETIPTEARPCSVGIERRWMLSADHPVRATGAFSWFSRDFATYDLANSVSFFQSAPSKWDELPGRLPLEQLDWFVIPPPHTPMETARLRWLNDRTVFEGYFYRRVENETGSLLLRRRLDEDAGRRRPFWELEDERARQEPTIAHFAGGVDLIDVEVVPLPDVWAGLRIDTRWRLPVSEGVRHIAVVSVMNRHRGMLALYQNWIVPGDEIGQRERSGAALRDSRYLSLLSKPKSGDLRIEVRVVPFRAEGEPPITQELRVPGREDVKEGKQAVFVITVPYRPGEPEPLPGLPEPSLDGLLPSG